MNILSRSTVIAVLAISQFTLAQEVNKQNTSTTNVVVEQPTTTVEATPLVESPAERMRKQRQEIEVQTEQKIVEKLENSRLEDEKRRADALFGNKNEVNVQKVEVVAPVYAPQQVPAQQVVPVQQPQAVVPAPVVVEQKVTPADLSSAKKEILDAISEKEKVAVETKALVDIPIVERRLMYYVETALGSAEYGSAVNISGRGAFGVTLGYDIDRNMQIEGNFVYSNYYMDDYYWVTVTPVFKELAQYNIGSTLKYSFLTGRFRPYVGGSVDFTYRRYFDRLVYTWNGAYIPQDKEATSYAIDLGFVTGADFIVTDQFAVGLTFTYSTNIMYRTQSEIIDHQYRAAGANLVEETDYSMFLLTGKFRF